MQHDHVKSTGGFRFSLRTLLIAVAVVALASYYIHRQLSRFEVVALIHVRNVAPGDPPGTTWWPEYPGATTTEIIEHQVLTIKSPEMVSEAVINAQKANKDLSTETYISNDWLRPHLNVTNPQECEIIRVSLTGNTTRNRPEDLVELLTALCEAYASQTNEQANRVRILQMPMVR